MKTRCVIVAGGECDSRLGQHVGDGDFVIAADSGLKYCQNFNIEPDLIVGDFDSFEGVLPQGIETIKLPQHKDDTDLLFAARCGVERGFDRFVIFGGYGSRPDQNMAMYQTLLWLVNNRRGAEISAVCNGFEVYAIKNGSKTFKKADDRYISVFAVGKTAFGVSIEGAEYPLNDATVTPDFPIGVSNKTVTDTTVSVRDGTLLVMTVDKNI